MPSGMNGELRIFSTSSRTLASSSETGQEVDAAGVALIGQLGPQDVMVNVTIAAVGVVG